MGETEMTCTRSVKGETVSRVLLVFRVPFCLDRVAMMDWVLDWKLEDIKSSDSLTPYEVANLLIQLPTSL